jgi:hypothetical protein
VMRDLAGTLRTLATLDPAVIEHLDNQRGRSMPGSARWQAVHTALAELVGPDRDRIMPGHGWLSAPFVLGRGYQR